MLWDWVEIDTFSNMADSVNTSLGVHLSENLQAPNTGSQTCKCLAVLYRVCPSWTKSLHFSFSTAPFCAHLIDLGRVNQPLPLSPPPLSASLYLSEQELQQTLLAWRWEIKSNSGKVKKGMPAPERSVPCGTEHVHTAPHLLSGVELSTAGQAMEKGKRSRGQMGVVTCVELGWRCELSKGLLAQCLI